MLFLIIIFMHLSVYYNGAHSVSPSLLQGGKMAVGEIIKSPILQAVVPIQMMTTQHQKLTLKKPLRTLN